MIAIDQTKRKAVQFKCKDNVGVNGIQGIVHILVLPPIVSKRPHSVVLGLSSDERHGSRANNDIHDDNSVLSFNNDICDKALRSRAEERRGDIERVGAPCSVPSTGLIHSILLGRRRNGNSGDSGCGFTGNRDGEAMSRTTRDCTWRAKLQTTFCLYIMRE